MVRREVYSGLDQGKSCSQHSDEDLDDALDDDLDTDHGMNSNEEDSWPLASLGDEFLSMLQVLRLILMMILKRILKMLLKILRATLDSFDLLSNNLQLQSLVLHIVDPEHLYC